MIRLISRISWPQIKKLLHLFWKYPQFLLPTFFASWRTLRICQSKFGKKHFGNGIENAYRHALWIMFIRWYSRNRKESITWTTYFSYQYESIFPSEDRYNLMDQHNNKVGINAFLRFSPQSKKDILALAENKMETALSFQTDDELKELMTGFPETLLYENRKNNEK